MPLGVTEDNNRENDMMNGIEAIEQPELSRYQSHRSRLVQFKNVVDDIWTGDMPVNRKLLHKMA